MLKNRTFLLACALGAGVLLGGCAAQAPSLAYKGPAQAGALAGKVVCPTIDFQGANFAQLKPTKEHPEYNGSAVMQPAELDSVYGNQIVSALRQEGATISKDPKHADIVIHALLHPAPGHTHLVWTEYEMGKTMAMALIPLTHSRYYIQHDQLVDDITITAKGQAPKHLTIPLVQTVPYKSTTLTGGAQMMDDMRIYRNLQAKAVKQVLQALH